jgi:hypothetical protein
MFKKIDVSLQYSDIEYKNKVTEYGIPLVINGEQKPSICYHSFVGDIKNQMLSLIHEQHRSKFQVQVMEIIGYIGPHTDSDVLCTVNFYVETTGERTVFFNLNEGAVGKIAANQTNGRSFAFSEVTTVDSFIAKPGDIWVLDVTRPHCVLPTTSTVKRKAIVLNTNDFSYQEVLDMIENKKGE